MEIEAVDINGYRVLRIKEDLTRDSNLTKFKSLVKPHLDEGVKNLALSFTRDSYFYSRTIAIIVQFMGHIKENDGNIAIIHPNNGVLEMIKLVGLGKLIETYTSEDSLGTKRGGMGKSSDGEVAEEKP
jgi:anti-anti-sigma factor